MGGMHRGRAAGHGVYLEAGGRRVEDIEVEPTRTYYVEDARAFLADQGVDVDAIAPLVDGKFMSAFIRAKKPQAEGTKG